VDPAGTAFTSILVKDDFMINLHQVETTKPLVFKEGGYPLGFDEGAPRIVSAPGAEAAYQDGKLTFIRNLAGYTRQFPAQGFADDVNGSNVRYRQSVVPVLGHESGTTQKLYLASLVCARVGSDSMESLLGLVTSFELDGNRASIRFHDGERVFLQIGAIGEVKLELNGKSVSGAIVLARVSADGSAWFVLHRDGRVDSKGEA
jgi:hypothetical protein